MKDRISVAKIAPLWENRLVNKHVTVKTGFEPAKLQESFVVTVG
jgi:hypothetical protein